VEIDPATDLYGGVLFQGPLFQRLERVWSMTSAGSMLAIQRSAGARYFSPRFSPELILGDPASRDVLLQSAQLSVKGVLLPIGIDALHLYEAPASDRDMVVARTVMTSRDAAGASCHVTAASGPDRRPFERLVGYRLKQMEHDDAAPEPEDLAAPGGRDARILASAVAAAGEGFQLSLPECSLTFLPQLSRLDRTMRRLRETPLLLDVTARALAASGQRLTGTPEVCWRDDGKPWVRSGAADAVDVSLSHDRSHCLVVAGRGPQGCDLEPIEPRSRAEWLRLVGEHREPLFQQLVDGGDSPDEAGTRIWCALETVTKALGVREAGLTILRRHEQRVLLSARSERGAVRVVTLPLALTRPPRKMLAVTAATPVSAPPEEGRRPVPAELPASNERIDAPAAARVAPASPAPAGAAGAPAAARIAPGAPAAPRRAPATFDAGVPVLQPELRSRFRVTFKDVTTSLHGLQFDTFADWMGRLRELAIAPVAKELVADFTSGKWGMVTNHSSVHVVGRVECLDLVEGRMRVSRAYGKFGSSVDLRFEWVRIDDDGSEETFAFSEMATTWVEILGHGVVEVRPFPAYMKHLIAAYLALEDGEDGPDLAPVAGEIGGRAPEPDARLGEAIYLAPRAPKVEPELLRTTFDTASAESNLVGNIYYANYYHWQARLIDGLLHGIASGQPAGARGELTCVRSSVAHVREAMPFDRIEVAMALQALHRGGLTLHFDFYRVAEDGQRTKLAVGDHVAVWTDAATGVAGELPPLVLSLLSGRIPVAA
jgi:phosphopantetheinyl transferase/acyl-CoA thioesterase FadM